MRKHTSVYLNEGIEEQIKRTGKPMNAVINDALEAYFSVTPIDEEQIEKVVKNYLESEKMQSFFLSEIQRTILSAIGSYMPKVDKNEMLKKLKS